MDEVVELDMKAFEKAASQSRAVAGRTNSRHTVHSHLVDIRSLFKHAKVAFPCWKLKQPKKLKTVYDRETQIRPFFEKLDEESYIMFGLNYFLGLREGEVRNAEDTDISFSAKTFHVQAKQHLGWKPKKEKERLVPIPTFFLERLKNWVEAHPDRHLLFIPRTQGRGLKSGTPRPKVRPFANNSILHRLHKIVRRLGLECGHCENCINPSPGRFCTNWKTHKFRATNITHKTQSGMDLETAAVQAGHEHIATTSGYTAAAVPTQVQDFIDNIDWFKNPYSRRQQTGTGDPAASMLALVQYLQSNGYNQEQISQILSGAGKDLLPRPQPKGPVLVKAS
jgi:integrase